MSVVLAIDRKSQRYFRNSRLNDHSKQYKINYCCRGVGGGSSPKPALSKSTPELHHVTSRLSGSKVLGQKTSSDFPFNLM